MSCIFCEIAKGELNCNKHAGQTVMHLHFHVLGKRELSWPPG